MTTGYLKNDGQISREPSILDLTESTAPGNETGVGKFYVSSSDNKPRFVASGGTDYDLTVGSAAGSDGQIQFNSGGTNLGADADLHWDNTNKWLSIGNNSPTDALTISSDSDVNDGTLTVHRGGVSGGPYLKLKRSRGTYDSPTVISNNDTIANIAMQAYDGSAYNYGAAISSIATETWDASSHGTKINFGVVANGSTTLSTRLSLQDDGSLWFDQISPPSTTTDKLYNDSGDLYWDGSKLLEGIRIDNIDVDSPSEVVDSFSESVCTGAWWNYVVSKGSNYRTGRVNACWNPDTDEVSYRTESTVDLGDTSDVTFSVDISSNTVRLIATVASDNWSVRTKRFYIDD